MNAVTVGKRLIISQLLKHTRTHTGEKNPMNVIIVENLSPLILTFLCTREYITGGYECRN